MSELQEATKEFLIETHENLDQLDTDLVGLAQSTAPGEALGRIFRTLHTVKGSCSFLGFPNLESVAHAGEDLLGKLRDGQLALRPDVSEALLRMVDVIRDMLAQVEIAGNDGPAQPSLIESLKRLARAEVPARPSEDSLLIGFDRPPSQVSLKLPGDGEAAGVASPSETSTVHDASVRLNVDLLDKLMAIAGEIVLARNQILQYSQRHGDPAFQNTCRQLNLITTELQEHVMKTRLQPLSNVWNRFPRLVHDAAQSCGKKVRLEVEGSETELDKALLEAIRDPLTHLVRNAIDHGIEPPPRRLAASKPAEGCVRLRAFHEGGQVNIEVSDDGGGIDPDRVKHRAVDLHLLTSEQASRMGTRTILGLIFLPGFSTATAVTTVSGRGVGMDVVKTNVEKIGGSVDVLSRVGEGTTFRIRIPLTLAIIKALIVTSAGDRYAIPQNGIVELIRVEGEKARKGIQRVHGVHVYRYRNRLLPLVDLNQALDVEALDPGEEQAVNIVVLQAADKPFGLVVDAINDTQEIVVKPLWKRLKGLACFAGATVMGDGRVALILDVFGLAQRAGCVSDQSGWSEAQPPSVRPAERPSMLLVEGRSGGRLAIPLDRVVRLEEFPPSRVEQVAHRPVVQYDGGILPLLDIESALGSSADRPAPDRDAAVPVVVYARQGRPIGLVVRRILDVVGLDSDIEGPSSRPGVERTAVIRGRVTEMLDIDALARAVEG